MAARVVTALRTKHAAATVLLVTLFIALFAIPIIVMEAQAIRQGYGTGFSNQSYVPPSVALAAGLKPGATPEQVVKATAHIYPDRFWPDTWRLTATILIIVGLIVFWYYIMSQLGTF